MEFPDSLEQCHLLIRRLLEENAVLRRSGAAFGHLAERLDHQLQEEHRLGDRRRTGRAGDDRGAPPAAGASEAEKLSR
ncbi:MAG: hypothetical protein ABI603_05700 [Acidobacteriota bacterium]